MVENKEYSPSLVEWDELVMLWNRSKAMFASALVSNAKARIAWTTKLFVESHPNVTHAAVYVWLERNLEIARGSSPVRERLPATIQHDEITAVHRIPRSTHGHVTTLADDPGPASSSLLAAGQGVHRQG